METLQHFVERLCKGVGCYHKRNTTNYSLKKYASNNKGHMGVFAWVDGFKTKDFFLVTTYKCLADGKGITDADREKLNAHFIPKGKDPKGKGTGLYFYVAQNSTGRDYQKTVRALRVIMQNR